MILARHVRVPPSPPMANVCSRVRGPHVERDAGLQCEAPRLTARLGCPDVARLGRRPQHPTSSEDHTVPVRSLRQEEAVERAALLSVTSYDIAVDLTDLVDGPTFRAVSTVRFTATPGRRRSSTAARRWSRRRSTASRCPRRRTGASRWTASPRTTSSWWPRRRATPRTGVACTARSTPVTKRLPLDHLRARRGAVRLGLLRPARPQGAARVHRHRAGGSGPWSATPATRASRTSTADDGGRSSPRRRCRRTTRWCVAGPFVEVRREAGGHDLGLYARRRWRPPSSATPSSSSRSPSRAWPSSASGSACPSRSAATTRSSCPSSVARWRTTAASPGPTTSCAATSRPPASGRCSPTCCCTRWRTCGSATSSPCAGGTTSGSTRPSPSSPACGPPSGPPPTATRPPTTWWATSCTPTSPTRAPARTPSASPCPRWPTPSRSSTPSPIPRAPRCSSSSCTSSARTPSARA